MKFQIIDILESTEEIRFSQAALQMIDKIKKRYPENSRKSALIPVLHIAQAESGGWLSPHVMDYVADMLGIKPVEVYEVATFYTLFNLKPAGRYIFEVCRTGPCCLCGAEEIISYLESKLNIKTGETTSDGMFTIKTVDCLAACGNAPVIKVGVDYHENMNNDKIDLLVDNLHLENRSSHQNPYE